MGRASRIVTETEAWCSGCKQMVLLINFSVDTGRKEGINTYCKDCKSNIDKTYYKANSQKIIDWQRENNYGISAEEYQELWERQDGKCASCGHPETLVKYGQVCKLAVDHCHITGAIRGLLCANCNRALGLLFEDPERIEALLKYVQEKVLW